MSGDRCVKCYEAVISNRGPFEGHGWWSESFPLAKPPFHWSKQISMEAVPEFKGNFSGTLNVCRMRAACGKEFKVEIDSGD